MPLKCSKHGCLKLLSADNSLNFILKGLGRNNNNKKSKPAFPVRRHTYPLEQCFAGLKGPEKGIMGEC